MTSRNGVSALGPTTTAAYRTAAWVGHWWAPARGRRRAALARWRAWAASRRPVIWVHAASVGEALTALPVCQRLKRAAPEWAIGLTFTSPSVERWPGAVPVDHADYLPPDLPGPMEEMLDALRPRALVYSRADLWPELTRAATARGVPIAIAGATVSRGSARLKWPARRLFHSLYRVIAYAGAVSAEDADRLVRLGGRPDAVEVTGDPRHEQVLERVPDGKVLRQLEPWAAPGGVLVGGSTEPPDEPVLLQAFAAVRRRRPTARLLLCPHDPGPRRSSVIADQARRAGIEAAAWSAGQPPAAPCLIVERSGVLADLYALGTLAYVGGGFGPRGVHAVVEPAACAIPVIIGPRGHGTDAAALLRVGGAVALPRRHAVPALVRSWEAWLTDDDARADAGLAARHVLAAGAAQRTAARLLGLMGDR